LLFLGLAFVFGLGYYRVSRDLTKNYEIVKMGILGKLIVFIGLTWAGATGQVHWILIVPGIVDLVFAILYIEFLMTSEKGV